jgi:hypothetical protein
MTMTIEQHCTSLPRCARLLHRDARRSNVVHSIELLYESKCTGYVRDARTGYPQRALGSRSDKNIDTFCGKTGDVSFSRRASWPARDLCR